MYSLQHVDRASACLSCVKQVIVPFFYTKVECKDKVKYLLPFTSVCTAV